MKKIWRTVQEFPRYEASNYGEIKIKAKNKIISQRTSKDGYKKLNIYTDGKLYTRSTHRVVLEAFKPKPEGKMQVNHIDGNKLNNCLNNLEWCRDFENKTHAIEKLGTVFGNKKILSDSDILRIRKLLKHRVKQSIIAKHFKISQPYISEIKHGKKRKNIG